MRSGIETKGPKQLEPYTLVIFDFSGTLSLGAVDFGKPDRLQQHLEKSGLAAIGIDTADRYWRGVVNPTWAKASRSATGFKTIAADYIRSQGLSKASRKSITAALSRFVDAYLHCSHIDPKWQPLLAEIQQAPDAFGLVATDHYAEATIAIREHLAAVGITATAASGLKGPQKQTPFIVANSADIGCPKAEGRFWQTLQATCLPMPLKKVILVDDFGLSEQAADGYAQPDRITERIAATQMALGEVLQVVPRIIQFRIEGEPADAIAATVQSVRKALQA